ncbi:hypothetical protein SAMN04515621_2898 [Erythrobacter sp. HL-111]|nr:MAG: hypothetical protein HLUCCO15_12020 [Erythrobacteraceae bacterium HL-111]SDT09549.1 hypothetical protein SAMN04515621_2898 [Erythrobacter sp. HL-111]
MTRHLASKAPAHRLVLPAKAGARGSGHGTSEFWVPAFAGMTVER